MIFAEFAGHREEAAVRAALTDLRTHRGARPLPSPRMPGGRGGAGGGKVALDFLIPSKPRLIPQRRGPPVPSPHASFVTVLGSFINREGPTAGPGHLPPPAAPAPQ